MAEKYLNLVGNIESITKNGVGVINNFPLTFQVAVWDFVKKNSLPVRRSEDDDRGNRLIRIDVFCTQEGAETIKEGVARILPDYAVASWLAQGSDGFYYIF